MMFVHPEEVKSANIIVKNIGNFNDTALIDLSIVNKEMMAKGWEVWVDEDEIFLGPDNGSRIRFFVKGPNLCEPQDYIDVNLTVTSQADQKKTDTIILWIHVV